MSEMLENISVNAAKNNQEMMEMIERLYQVARPEAVFGEPLEVGEQVVLTASEVNLGLGVGFGIGGGPRPGLQRKKASQAENDDPETPGMGGGGGGGGGAQGRPVAVISVDEAGVEVEPILDMTKIMLAFFTALGTMFMMFSQMKKGK